MPVSESPGPSPALTTLCLLLVIAGAWAYVERRATADVAALRLQVADELWAVPGQPPAARADRALHHDRDGAGLPPRPGVARWIEAPGADDARLEALELHVRPRHAHSASIDLQFPGEPLELRLAVMPSGAHVASLSVRGPGEGWREVDRRQLPLPPRAVGVPPPDLELVVTLDPGRVGVRLDGRTLLRTALPAQPRPERARLWLGAADLRRLEVYARQPDGGHRLVVEDFTALSELARRARGRRALLEVLGVLVLGASWLAAQLRGRRVLPRALALLPVVLAPAALLLLLARVLPLPDALVGGAGALLALPLLGAGLARASAAASAAPADDAASEFAPESARESAPDPTRDAAPNAVRLARRPLLRAALGAALVLAAAWCAARLAAERAEHARREHATYAGLGRAQPWRLDAPVALDLGNALVVPGAWRDVAVRAQLELTPGAVLELRLRTSERRTDAVAWVGGDRGRYGAAFVHHGERPFEILAHHERSPPTGTPFALELRAVGDSLRARVDDGPWLTARSDVAPLGAVQLMVASGAARVTALHVEPLPGGGAPLVPDVAGALAALGVLAGAALLAAASARGLGTGLAAALARTAFVWVPLALAAGAALGDGALDASARGAALAASALLGALHVPAWLAARQGAGPPARARGAGDARADVRASRRALAARWAVAALAVLLPSGAVLALVPARDGGELPDARRLDVFPGPRLSDGLVSFEHPAVRRYNAWLRRHQFRGLDVAQTRPPGTLRVIAVGSSSTVGHGLPPRAHRDYPAVAWRELRQRLPEQPVEIVNAAVSGSTAARLLRFFDEVLVAFEPHVVTLCLTYNDAGALSRVDEHAWLERITRPDYVRDAATRRADALALARGNDRLRALRDAFAAHGPPTRPLWDALPGTAQLRAPPESFAEALRAWARSCAAVGAELVLVKEPVRHDGPLLWKQEYRAAIDAVAAEFDLRVLDPTPALLAAERAGHDLFMDEVHPNAQGHAVIAAELVELLDPLLRELGERR